jgi:hypothetical protein
MMLEPMTRTLLRFEAELTHGSNAGTACSQSIMSNLIMRGYSYI